MATDADALPRIDRRYGEKCAALLWQLQQNEPAQEQLSVAATRKSVLAAKYGVAVPKSAGCRGPGTAAGGGGCESSALSTALKQQRPSSMRAMAKKSGGVNPSFDQASQASQAPQATRSRFSSSRVFNNAESDQVQAQQLEAAHNVDPIRAFSSPRSFVNGNMYADNSSAELELVRCENDNLRLEIAVLHEKMMEKMRGGSKIVAGGQFRGRVMASGSKNAQPPPTAVNCSTCATLRLDLKRSRHEFTHSQHIGEELHREIAKMEAIQHTLWAENSSQQREINALEERITEFQQDQNAKDDKIRMLEQQAVANRNAQVTEDNNEANRSGSHASVVDSAMQCSPERGGQEQLTDAEFAQRNASLAEEVSRLKLELAAHESEMRHTSRVCDEAQKALQKERSGHEAYCLKRTRCEENYIHQLNQLEQTLQAIQRELTVLQECKAKDSRHLEEDLNAMNARLHDQLQQHTETVSQFDATNEELLNTNQRLQLQVTELEARNASQLSEAGDVSSRFQEAQVTNSQLVSENTRLRHEIQEITRQLSEQSQKVEETQANLAILGSEIESWQRKAESPETKLQVAGKRLQEALASSSEDQELMQVQLAALEYKNACNEDFVIKLKNSHAAALQDALYSTIRLCVVAPTVNVHLSETPAIGSSPSTASKNDPVVCKPPPPRDRIREIVENEILPQFTRLVLQEESKEERGGSVGESPPSSSVIEPWIRELLQSMQKKIVEQLESIYKTASA